VQDFFRQQQGCRLFGANMAPSIVEKTCGSDV